MCNYGKYLKVHKNTLVTIVPNWIVKRKVKADFLGVLIVRREQICPSFFYESVNWGQKIKLFSLEINPRTLYLFH